MSLTETTHFIFTDYLFLQVEHIQSSDETIERFYDQAQCKLVEVLVYWMMKPLFHCLRGDSSTSDPWAHTLFHDDTKLIWPVFKRKLKEIIKIWMYNAFVLKHSWEIWRELNTTVSIIKWIFIIT